MARLRIVGFILVLSLACPLVARSQVATGMPVFGSFASSGPETINLANLNDHIEIPIRIKAGRGMPFSYILGYDSAVWTPVQSGSNKVWQPSPTWGWRAQTDAAFGGVVQSGGTTTRNVCPPGSMVHYEIITDTTLIYTDPFGTSHIVPNAESWLTCDGDQWFYGGPTVDGSGYYVDWLDFNSFVVKGANGTWFVPGSAGSGKDSNGNYLSYNSSTSSFTDTLGQTVLTIGTVGSSPQSTTFTYKTASNTDATYTLHYSYFTVQTYFQCSGVSEYGPSQQALVDRIDLPDGTSYQINYEHTPNGSGNYSGRIASITLPTGGTITYAYSGGNLNHGIFCSDGSTATLTRTTPDGTWTYARTQGSGAASTNLVTDPENNQTTYQFQGVYETQRDVHQGSSTLLKTVTTCYNGSSSPCTGTTIALPITSRTIRTTLGGMSTQSKTDIFYTSMGLPTEIDAYDFGAGTATRKTTLTYATLGNNIIDRPASVVVKDGGNNTVTSVTYTYDEGTPTPTSGTPNHNSVTGSRGNPTTISYYVRSGFSLTKHFSYFDTGNMVTATDTNNAQTTYTYGNCGNSFPTLVQMPLSLSRSMAWDCVGGVMTSSTDENNKITTYAYTGASQDQYWRLLQVTDPLNNATVLNYTPTSVESAMSFGSSTVDVLQTLDSLGRPHVAQRRRGPGSANFDSVQADYDIVGRAFRSTMPYQGTAGQENNSPPYTSTVAYDALGRPLTISDGGNGAVSYTYTANDVYQALSPAPTGENQKRKQMEYDGLGRLTSVCELTSTSNGGGNCAQSSPQTGYWTRYTYDILGNLTGVSQNAQSGSPQTRSYSYDGLGRLTSEANPETNNVAVSYTYDSDATCGTYSGDLVKKVDAAGNNICYAYDALHRVTSIRYVSGPNASSTPTKCYIYDSATVNGQTMTAAKARLAEAFTIASGSCPGTTKLTDLGFSYSERGEVKDVYQKTPNSSGYYHVAATYWANGALSSLSGLGLPSLAYNVDGEGRPGTATASGQNLVSAINYNVSSQPTSVTLGSGDSDAFTYDANTGRLTQYKFTVGATPQTVTGNLAWNANGTLQQLAIADQFNAANSQTCSYAYDDLARVQSANCGSIWSQTFSFDPFGNINKSGTISFQPGYIKADGTTNNQYQSIPGSYASYDANGNLTYDSFHTYTWDADGNTTAVDSTTLTYDALDRMVEQYISGGYRQIVYAPTGQKLALMSGLTTLVKAFVPLPGGPTAVYTASGLSYYRHPDWLGSSRFASTPARTMYFSGAYAPYGEDYAKSGTTDLSFTGQNNDTVTDLYDFLFREYHPTQGRWLRPDPAGIQAAQAENPQSWNLYAYVANNPLALTDFLGLCHQNPAPSPTCDNVVWMKGRYQGWCEMDGGLAPCSMVMDFVGMGAAVPCPNNVCEGEYWASHPGMPNGGYWVNVNYRAFEGAGAGYYADFGPYAAYFSYDAAWKAAEHWALSLHLSNQETAGNIFEDANGIFSFNQTALGEVCTTVECIANLDPHDVPSGTFELAGWHTHPSISAGVFLMSQFDKDWANTWNLPLYMGFEESGYQMIEVFSPGFPTAINVSGPCIFTPGSKCGHH